MTEGKRVCVHDEGRTFALGPGLFQIAQISPEAVAAVLHEDKGILHPGDLVWITGKLTGVSNLLATAPGTTVDQCVYSAYLPGINPYTGQIMYLHYRDLIPVRG